MHATTKSGCALPESGARAMKKFFFRFFAHSGVKWPEKLNARNESGVACLKKKLSDFFKKLKNFFFRFLRIKDAIHAFGVTPTGTCMTHTYTEVKQSPLYHCASFPALAMPTVQPKA